MTVSNRICSQCSTSLAPNELFCSSCGTPYGDTSRESVQDASAQDAETASSLSEHTTAGEENQMPPFPSRRPRKSPVTLLVGIGILLFLLVVGGSLFFFVRAKSNTPSSIGGGVIPGITTGTPPLFTDDFANNSKGWAVGSGSGYTSVVGNHTMLLAEANHKILAEPIPADDSIPATYRDFAATTTFTITKADQNDSVGFYMRGDNNLSQGYFVDIFGDNTYDIVKVFPDVNRDTFLISPTNSTAINPVGQANRLTVIMKGPQIVVLINGKVVNAISDSAYKIGQIALFAENGRSSDGVKVTFSSISVYPAPEHLPA